MNAPRQHIAVIGLGYVGLPLAVHMAGRGARILGIDKDLAKIKQLQKGNSYIPDVPSADVGRLVENKLLVPSLPTRRLSEADTIIVTVPTPVTEGERKPDLSALREATRYIAKHLRKGQTIIYESSTYPGTLEEEIQPILAESGLEAGEEYYLCYSPERIDPGNRQYQLPQIPKVVSGLTPACLNQVKEIYSQYFDTIVPVSSPRVAEMCKIFENIQRLVNISLVNEMNLICQQMNVNFREALAAAATKPFGFTPYSPGPGIGGHCIPVDPLYFQWKAEKLGLSSTLIEEAHKINLNMPAAVVEQVGVLLATQNIENSPASVLLVGVAYKKDVNDVRESPALEIFRLLHEAGCQVEYHDPHVPEIRVADGIRYSVPLTADRLQQADVVVILTDHTQTDWALVEKEAKRIVDTRGVLEAIKERGSG